MSPSYVGIEPYVYSFFVFFVMWLWYTANSIFSSARNSWDPPYS